MTAADVLDVVDQTVVDAHQHFWDLSRYRYPWLQDPEPIAFRYGDYSALRRSYLPADYRRDAQDCGVVKTVHVEAEWERADPVAETRWLETLAQETGLPSACVAHAALDSLVGAYDVILAGFRAAIADRPVAAQRQLLSGNAIRIYRL